MAKQLFLNNFTTTFVAAVKDAPSSGTPATELDYGVLRVSDGAAGALINPTGGDFYVLTAYKRSGSTESNVEIMRVTAVDNATPGECRITVQRAQEGTTTQAYLAGDYLSLRLTKGGAARFSQPDDLATKEPAIAAPASDATAKYWRGDKSWRDFATDVRGAVLTGLSTATNSAVTAADSVLAAIGKLQAQVTAKFDKSGGTISGNVAVTGQVTAGQGQTAAYPPAAFTAAETTNAATKRASIDIGKWSFIQDSNGNGARDLILYDIMNAKARLIFGTTGNVYVPGGTLGYGWGAGGSATQGSGSGKGTEVILNKPNGYIVMAAGEIAVGAAAQFKLTNSYVTRSSHVFVTILEGCAVTDYQIQTYVGVTGAVYISLRNMTPAALNNQPVLNFVVFNGSTS